MTKKEIDIIKRVISVLNSVDYARYSDGRSKNYLEYASGAWKDERKLIAPIIFPKFLEQVLGFSLGENIGTQETASEGKDIPDYIPVDTRTHPFVFDCKGMDTDNLSKWYPQIKRYLEGQGLRYGILTNMRDLDVYTLESEEEIEAFNFNFVQLYKDYKENLSNILERENTKHFLKFAERFKHILLTIDEKFKRIAEAKPWTGKETLNIDLLIKRLRHVVECIHEDATVNKEALILLKESDPERAKAIVQEIELIASEIERSREIKKASIETFEDIIKASPKSLLGRALDIFFYRVGYFTMTRLLLARAWEDIGFIDQSLYDGSLAKWYQNFNREIRRVLKYAFGLAAERYKWLFNVDNNYTWYEPSDDTLIEVLYELANFNLGKLNQDVLGTIYEEYIDKVDKRQKGQYYTPREIIEFIWNRVGFTNPKAFFWHIEGKRRPKFIFDPATGSGGFLVEAARRIRDESDINWNDSQDLIDIRTAILVGILGSEISVFPYYITEVNLLIQLTPVIKKMMDINRAYRGKGTPALGIVPIDALSLYSLPSLLPEEEYKFDHIRNLLPLEEQKKTIFRKIKKEYDGKFSYCCSNPPYIGEKGNKELFRATLQRFPYWKESYQGKMDYLYFFIILGLSKLHNPEERTPGGKLGFITTAYWPTADGASKLRKYILENAKIKEMIFFEDVKIFEYAKGQHNMVFILEKYAGKKREKERAENRIKIVRVLAKHQEIPGDSIREKLRFLAQHIQKHIDKSQWQDEYIKVLVCSIKQGELTDGPWGLFIEESSEKIIHQIEAVKTKLKEYWSIDQGVVPNPLRLTKSKLEELSRETVQRYDLKIGDGVFVLTKKELDNLALTKMEYEIIKPYFKNSDISKYITSEETNDYLIYTTSATKIDSYHNIKRHLEKFRSILSKRRECEAGRITWFSLHWARAQKIFEGEKIVCSYRTEEASFAYHEGSFYGSTDMYFIKCRDANNRHSLKYLLAILNSRLMDFWLSKKGKSKGSVTEQFATPLENIYIRRIDFNNSEDVKFHDNLVKLVDRIIEAKRKLAKFNTFFLDVRLTHSSEKVPLPDINPESILKFLASEKQFSLRTHPDIKITYGRDFEETKFILDKIGKIDLTLEGPELKLVGKDRKVIVLKDKGGLLQIISSILENHKGESWITIKEIPLISETAEDYNDKKQEIMKKVMTLRNEIQELQTSIDAIVFKLYGISENLVIRE